MTKKILLFILLIFTSLSISSTSVKFDRNNFTITETKYEKKNKSYIDYQYTTTKENILSKNFDTLDVIISSPSSSSLGSFAGHAFFVLSNDGDYSNSISINFFGESAQLSSYDKYVTGSINGLKGLIDIRPFSQIAERYTVAQNRTLYYYNIDISKTDINKLIDEVFKVKKDSFLFNFFTYNCADLSLITLGNALNLDLKKNFPSILIPSYLPEILNHNNLVKKEGTISPPIVKYKKEKTGLTKEEILKKQLFYTENLRETSFLDNNKKFIPYRDLYDYGSHLDTYMSQVSFGMKNYKPTFRLSPFSTMRYQQCQGPTDALQINFFELNLIYDKHLKVDNFTIYEYNAYPKINYKFGLTKKIKLYGGKDIKGKLTPALYGGFGFSLGTPSILFDVTSDFDIPLSKLGIILSLNGEFLIYNKNAYLMIEGNLPYFDKNYSKEKSLKSKIGITLFNRLDISGNYDILNKDFNASITWNYNLFNII